MWDALLSEAARLCSEERSSSSAVLSRCAASIVLARSSLDAYLSEFIEWRRLSPRIKRARFSDALTRICEELSLPPPSFAGGLWGELSLLNDIRNELVHHKAARFEAGQSPEGIIERLVAHGVMGKPSSDRTWETMVASEPTARWACTLVGRVIIHLESIPNQRHRSLLIVTNRVNRILSMVNTSIGRPSGGDHGPAD